MSVPPSTPSGAARIEELLKGVVDLHTLPIIILEADRLMRDPRTSAQQVADLLARDPALAGRILRLVNSPYYGFQRRIGNLTQAIVILGFQTVKNLMLTVSVIESFQGTEVDVFDYPKFWSHSVACAIAAREIARLAKSPHAEKAYIAGLLHDVGKLLLAQHLPEQVTAVEERILQGCTRLEAEQAVFGYDHSDVGGMLSQAWSLPDSVTCAIRDHHAPAESPVRGAADIVHLANILVSTLGLSHEATVSGATPGLSERLGYDEAKLSFWIERIAALLLQAQEFFEVVGAKPLQLTH